MSIAKHRDSTLYLVGFRYDEMTGDRVLLTKPVPVGMTTNSLDRGDTVIDFISSEGVSSTVPMLDIPEGTTYFGVFDALEDDDGPRLLVRFDRDVFTASGVGVGLAVVPIGNKSAARIQIRSIP
jgi:hypothetical protein